MSDPKDDDGPGYPYPLSLVPQWCGMSPPGHRDGMGGCWGILHGFVQKQGEPYCKPCDEYRFPGQCDDRR